MPSDVLTIATRKSPLALWQAELVRGRLLETAPEIRVELATMTTQGDKILDSPLAKIGGKGLFVKELEQGLLEGRADIAVHSVKDVPVDLPAGLYMPVVLEREDPRDAFVSQEFQRLEDLPQGARVGTSSLRRQCQLSAIRPDLVIVALRGNVQTRLNALDDHRCDAVILAAAGLKRLGLAAMIAQYLDPTVSLPAIGQGAIGIECRIDDPRVNQLVSPLNHAETQVRVTAERAFNRRLEGGCQVPIAGYAELTDGALWFRGLVGRPNGTEVLRGEARGALKEAEALGTNVAEDLLARGAAEILSTVYGR